VFFNPDYLSKLFSWFTLDRTIWNKSRHCQFDWACAVHLRWWRSWELQYWHEYVKISVDNKTSFEKLNPFSMY